MRNEIEDLLFDFKDQTGIEITFKDMDAIMEQCLILPGLGGHEDASGFVIRKATVRC
jgi:nanoRNase/pAp phosphatase (c-di-AMP/oligoRNAs hydrolase)